MIELQTLIDVAKIGGGCTIGVGMILTLAGQISKLTGYHRTASTETGITLIIDGGGFYTLILMIEIISTNLGII